MLKVYDVLGREVATLVDEFKEAGYHEVAIDGTNYSSGIYFYRIQSGGFMQLKKMMVVR
ncbi:MAG: T9SS type A sorting domain-containing protein [Bacteroidota bacterium]|nr:T9SS type A sorting domain-containing protein [Bacteroidota bacterium]